MVAAMNRREFKLLCASALLHYSGLLRVINWSHRHMGKRLLILNYHQASGGELRRHLLYLRKHFRLCFVEQALESLYSTGEDQTSIRDRRLPLAITFDDGYLDNYTVAYKLAHELQVPITIFLISNYIERDTAFWWFDKLVEKARVEQVNIDGQVYRLNRPDEQCRLAQAIDSKIRSMADKEMRQTYINTVGKALSLPNTALTRAAEEPMPLLTWAQIREMQASGRVAFGGHTLHHATLAKLLNADETYREIADCRSLLQEKLGRPVRVFAYPHGGLQHIEANGLLAVREAGYEWAVTTLQGVNTPKTHPYLVRRISAHSRLHWLIIALVTSGAWEFLSYLNWRFSTRMKYRKILEKMRECLRV